MLIMAWLKSVAAAVGNTVSQLTTNFESLEPKTVQVLENFENQLQILNNFLKSRPDLQTLLETEEFSKFRERNHIDRYCPNFDELEAKFDKVNDDLTSSDTDRCEVLLNNIALCFRDLRDNRVIYNPTDKVSSSLEDDAIFFRKCFDNPDNGPHTKEGSRNAISWMEDSFVSDIESNQLTITKVIEYISQYQDLIPYANLKTQSNVNNSSLQGRVSKDNLDITIA